MSLNCAYCKKPIKGKEELSISYNVIYRGFSGYIINPYHKLCMDNKKTKNPRYWQDMLKDKGNLDNLKSRTKIWNNITIFLLATFILMIWVLAKDFLIAIILSAISLLFFGWQIYLGRRNVKYIEEINKL